jgi:hypothetical protein
MNGMATVSTMQEAVAGYDKMGWALVPIPAGSKRPTTFGWQTKPAPISHWDANPTHNVGLLHALSGTVAFDIDNMEHTRLICAAMNIDLDSILNGAPRIVGRPDRGKVLFRAPDDIQLTTRKISWPVEGDPRQTEVVFELRAGSVQDVLPPSIHPDTGAPYRWAGPSPEGGLPPIPEQLLTIWRDWDRFRHQLADICPWRRTPEFRPPPKKNRKVGNQSQNVIGAYNEAVPIGEALEAAGYRQFGSRWLSPNSTSGLPGVVVFDDGRAFSHHASDPFDPEHSFDAFDLFCQYQHMGNVTNAVKAAAEILKISQIPEGPSEEDREMSRHGAKVWEAIRERQVDEGIPKHLLTVPGVLGDVVEYSAKTAIKRQPQFDVQTALAIGSVAMGRRFITDNRNMTGLFFLNIGKTGSGKEHANTVLEEVLEAADAIHLRGPNGYTSAPGVISSLKDKPTHIAVIDEFGSMLSSAGARGNQHKKDALTMMMEAFGRQTKTLRNVGYATLQMTEGQKKALDVEIKCPSITVIGMTTPETFYEAIGGKDVASGFLNRFLIVESHRPRELSRTPAMIDPPQSVVDWVKASSKATGGGGGMLQQDNGHEMPPMPVLIPFSKAARELLRDYERRLNEWQDDLPPVQGDMLNRTREIAMRLSLIVAHSLGDKEITEAAAQWAIDYVDYYARQTLQTMSNNLAEGDTDALRKKVGECIMKAGPTGMTMRELIDSVPKLGNLKKYERDGLLEMVCVDYPIERMTSKPEGGKGRPSIIHRKIQEN